MDFAELLIIIEDLDLDLNLTMDLDLNLITDLDQDLIMDLKAFYPLSLEKCLICPLKEKDQVLKALLKANLLKDLENVEEKDKENS